MKSPLHLNCDLAESYGNLKAGDDNSILPFVDAVNIACGFHGGDPLTIESTIRAAIALGKQIGAHPSYPDLSGFGRRRMEMSSTELSSCLRYQICAVKGITESLGGHLSHVKVHGALYNTACKDRDTAAVIADTIASISADLMLMAPFESEMHLAASQAGLKTMFECFGDRLYDDDLNLVSREVPGAILQGSNDVLNQVQSLFQGYIITVSGQARKILCDTICVHGDHPDVVSSLRLIDSTIRKMHVD